MRRTWLSLVLSLLAAAVGTPGQGQQAKSTTLVAMLGPSPTGQAAQAYQSVRATSGRLTSLQQPISVDLTGVSLREAFDEVAHRGNLRLTYSNDVLPATKRVTLNASGMAVGDALLRLVDATDLDVLVTPSRHAVVVRHAARQAPAPAVDLRRLEVRQPEPRSIGPVRRERRDRVETGNVAGVVTDATTRQPVAGASVMLLGTTRGTITSADGRFLLVSVPAGSQTVRVRMMGYASMERTVEVVTGRMALVNFEIAPEAVALTEVVAVGYGTQRRGHLTGAVDQVGGEMLENRSVPNLTQGLQGVIPNVNIRPLDGKPIQAPQINVRGTTSIGQGGNALVLIDGVEGDPSMVNPHDIESVSVLKDASSAAVYGARGAFGVILITTKRPVRDRFTITYGSNYGRRQPTVPANYVIDGYTWARMFNESFFNWEGTLPQNVNKTMVFSQEYLAELERRSKNPVLPRTEIGPDGRYVYYESTDWYGLLYKESLPSVEQNLSISGSTDRASFLVSGRYLGQDGLFRFSSDDYRMLNLRATSSLQIFPWLQVDNNLNVSNRTYYNPLNVGEGGGIWRNLADEGHPLSPLLNPDGTLTHSSAYTVGDLYYGKNGMNLERGLFRNTTGATARLFHDRLTLKGDFSFQRSSDDELRRRVEIPYSRAPGVVEWLGTQFNDLRNTSDKRLYLAGNLYGDYQNVFRNRHRVNAVLGTNYEESSFERLQAQRNGLIFPDARNINLALGQSIVTSGNYEKWQILGGFYRLNYIFDERYLLEFNGRYDGSSKFPENERYAFFPSFSAGWRISNERFWKVSPRLVSDLKLRGSYGSMGNGNIGAYAFQEIFNIQQSSRILNGLQPRTTSAPSVLPDGLTWETVTTRNAGLDLDMIGGRLQFTGDVYRRLTTDMYTIGMTLPAIFGATSPRGNYADLKTDGWEATLAWRDGFRLAGRPFGYNLRLSLADHQSTILKYNNPDRFLNDYYAGMKVGEIWGFITEGFFTSEAEIAAHANQSLYRSHSSGKIQVGDIKLRDVNGDGTINMGDNTVDNPGDRVIIGNSTPRYRFGVNLGANWGSLFFSTFLQGVGKQDWYPIAESNAFWGQYNRPYGDIPSWHLKPGMIWSPENPNSFFPRYASRLANRNEGILRQPQSKYVMNAAYVRLRNIQLGYNLPPNLARRLRTDAARIYVSGDNLWTWSPLYRTVNNIDVENATAPSDQMFTSGNAGDGYNYPLLKGINVGMSLTF
jgi:TonB-linked SusC/RagA family outer membrane protein